MPRCTHRLCRLCRRHAHLQKDTARNLTPKKTVPERKGFDAAQSLQVWWYSFPIFTINKNKQASATTTLTWRGGLLPANSMLWYLAHRPATSCKSCNQVWGSGPILWMTTMKMLRQEKSRPCSPDFRHLAPWSSRSGARICHTGDSEHLGSRPICLPLETYKVSWKESLWSCIDRRHEYLLAWHTSRP